MSAVSQHLRRRYRLPILLSVKDVILDNGLDEILYRDPEYVTNINLKPAFIDDQNPEVHHNQTDLATAPTQKSEMTAAEVEPPGGMKLVPCPTCQRTFASDRLDAHKVICMKTTNNKRGVYDVAQVRIVGTEVEELVKKGQVKIEPAKPLPKKSELMKKYGTGAAVKATPAQDQKKADAKPNNAKTAAKGNGEAYQVYFDGNDKMKTRKPGVPMPRPGTRLPSQVIKTAAGGTTPKDRWLSASWRSRSHVSPDLNSYDDVDFLNSSMTSNKSVASDAFDFLFDENNLNPEKVLQDEFEETQKSLYINSGSKGGDEAPTTSSCCVIS